RARGFLVQHRRRQPALELEVEVAQRLQFGRRPAIEELRADRLARHLPGDGLLPLLAAVDQVPAGLVGEGAAGAVEAVDLVGGQERIDEFRGDALLPPCTHGALDRTATACGSVVRATLAPHAVVLASGPCWKWHFAPVVARAYADAPTRAKCRGNRAGRCRSPGPGQCRKPARTTFLLSCTTFSSATCRSAACNLLVASLRGAGAAPTMASALEIGHD